MTNTDPSWISIWQQLNYAVCQFIKVQTEMSRTSTVQKKKEKKKKLANDCSFTPGMCGYVTCMNSHPPIFIFSFVFKQLLQIWLLNSHLPPVCPPGHGSCSWQFQLRSSPQHLLRGQHISQTEFVPHIVDTLCTVRLSISRHSLLNLRDQSRKVCSVVSRVWLFSPEAF